MNHNNFYKGIFIVKKMENGLRFEEYLGKIEFVYTERVDGSSYRRIDGKIPERTVKLGEKAIREYALRKINQAKEKWKKFDALEEDIRKNHIPIKTKYEDGTLLEGRTVEATNRLIRVELDNPLKGEGSMNFRYASAMSGHFVFGEEYNISKHGYDGAYRALCGAYKDALHKPAKKFS